jgi:hypothetical protein
MGNHIPGEDVQWQVAQELGFQLEGWTWAGCGLKGVAHRLVLTLGWMLGTAEEAQNVKSFRLLQVEEPEQIDPNQITSCTCPSVIQGGRKEDVWLLIAHTKTLLPLVLSKAASHSHLPALSFP